MELSLENLCWILGLKGLSDSAKYTKLMSPLTACFLASTWWLKDFVSAFCRVAERSVHWIRNQVLLGLSPALATCWICSR